jgi:hypothetical protein
VEQVGGAKAALLVPDRSDARALVRHGDVVARRHGDAALVPAGVQVDVVDAEQPLDVSVEVHPVHDDVGLAGVVTLDDHGRLPVGNVLCGPALYIGPMAPRVGTGDPAYRPAMHIGGVADDAFWIRHRRRRADWVLAVAAHGGPRPS